MGDSCYMEVRCVLADAKRFEEWFDEPDDEEQPDKCGFVTLVAEEVNYAGNIPEDWPTDIPYRGWHGAGGSYAAERFVCLGDGELHVVASLDDSIVVFVDSTTGEPHSTDVEDVRKYLRALTVVHNHMVIRAEATARKLAEKGAKR